MKMYKKPITEVAAVDTERLMDGLIISINTGSSTSGGGGGTAGMPKRGEIIP